MACDLCIQARKNSAKAGLGKTLQGLTLLWTLVTDGHPLLGGKPMAKRTIIVCPTSLVSNWDSEATKWLKYWCLAGTARPPSGLMCVCLCVGVYWLLTIAKYWCLAGTARSPSGSRGLGLKDILFRVCDCLPECHLAPNWDCKSTERLKDLGMACVCIYGACA
eukprot:1161178-Pelagomonas_calceolata.AAC.10